MRTLYQPVWHCLLLLLIGMFFPACDKGFEEINRNPFSPTTTDIGPLFNQVISSLRLGWNEQFYLHNEKLYQVTQQAALTAETFQNINIGTEEIWSQYYTTLAHIREIERRLDAHEGASEATNNIRAQLKILTAYKTFRVTDLFGDIPFFEAGKGFEDVDAVRPAFDDQQEIYRHLLEELKWAVENMNLEPEPSTSSGEAYLSLGNFDTFFGGYLRQWERFANSLRLRHAVRMADKDPDFAYPIIQELMEGDAEMIGEGDDVVMLPAAQNWLNLSVNWSFREHKKLRLGTTTWEQMSESDEPDGSGIFDPRLFVFFEPNQAREWVPFPQVPQDSTPQSGGIPYQQHRDVSYDFKGQSNLYSPLNYYLVRDEKDIPEIIMTAAEVHYLKAEVYFRGLGVEANTPLAETEYTTGVAASMKFWQNIMVNSGIWENKAPILNSTEIFIRVNNLNISIFHPQNDKLQLIYTQRWLDAFRQPWEAFALLRRTNATPREGTPNTFFRFSYPPSETEKNPDNWNQQLQKMGADASTTKVWWMPD
ncbi:MAG: SusD/RagB family nutrient-binding outer membrane lipoprotein [Bacteroidota bacterium]